MTFKVTCYKKCNLGATTIFITTGGEKCGKNEINSHIAKIKSILGDENVLSINRLSNPYKSIAKFNNAFA